MRWSVIFRDHAGDEIDPADATVTVKCRREGELVEDEVALSKVGDSWVGSFETIDLDAGVVQWSARAGGLDRATEDGRFTVVANSANERVEA